MCEKWYRNLTLWLALVLLALALVAVSACGPTPTNTEVVKETEPPPKPTTPVPEETAVPAPTETIEITFTCEPGDELAPSVVVEDETAPEWDTIKQGDGFETQDGLTFVRDEVIVMGPAAEVSRVVTTVLGMESLERKRYVLTLSNLIPADVLERLPEEWRGDSVIGLYPTQGISATVAVYEINKEADEHAPVFAELNLVTGHPHSVAGSPHSVAGSPLNLDGISVTKAFWGQWALGSWPGIELVTATTDITATRRINDKGAGVQIAVFDSSPFETPGTWEIDWITPVLTLRVSHVLPQPTRPISPSDHGLFVCGLAHAVAPESEIHLIQALNENLTGTLGTLNYALARYMRQRLAENGQTLANTVMNFSLGIPYDPQSARFTPPNRQRYTTWIRAFAGDAIDPLEMPLPSFATLMALADHYGAALVAASGNGTEDPQNQIELPAAFPFVLGVQASGVNGTETCYTKRGDVAAPGGDPAPGRRCSKEVDRGCTRGMVSLAYRTSRCTGYACWIGTSFAAPLASGEVAAILGHCGGPILAGDLHDMVGASPGPGTKSVINLPTTFANPSCPP